MKLIVTETYEAMSRAAYGVIGPLVSKKKDAVLGLATGSTPLGLYRLMAEDRTVSYRDVKTVNLDEYAGLPAAHSQSYAYFMRENLFRYLDILPQNTHIPNGVAPDPAEECARYDGLLDRLPRDLQLLGIGSNGHIAFNEPGTPFDARTHIVTLAESTVRDNSRLFDRIEDVPKQAFTMGLADIVRAKTVVLLANGRNKAEAVRRLIEEDADPALPASALKQHEDLYVILDREAASLLHETA